jgi:adenylosuccinate lyase
MPHKRNPTTSERVCGLARLLRGHVGAMLEDVALWHERDLAHESVERVVVPDSLTVGHYLVTLATELLETLLAVDRQPAVGQGRPPPPRAPPRLPTRGHRPRGP